jgi:hypothetical protein
MENRSQRALRAAVAAAEGAGLRFDRPAVLRDGSNLLVHLRPAPVVARVATRTATIRRGDAWLAREVAVARYLAGAGAPVVAPSSELPPGPHRHDGFTVTFWEHVEERDAPIDPQRAGSALRECHEALAGYAGELPRMALLHETETVIEVLVAQGTLDAADGAVLRAAAEATRERIEALGLPLQPVHGDAHLGNVVDSPRGPLWNDWEDTFLGPTAWDLACLHGSARAFGLPAEPVAAAQRGYGPAPDAAILDAFVEARRLQGTAWTFVLGDPAEAAELLAHYRH